MKLTLLAFQKIIFWLITGTSSFNLLDAAAFLVIAYRSVSESLPAYQYFYLFRLLHLQCPRSCCRLIWYWNWSCQAYLDCTLKIPNLANVISHFCLSVFAYLITRYKMSGVFFISEQSILITDWVAAWHNVSDGESHGTVLEIWWKMTRQLCHRLPLPALLTQQMLNY